MLFFTSDAAATATTATATAATPYRIDSKPHL